MAEADRGAAGLARLAGDTFDLVLTDLGMPEMTGWEVAEAAKARAPGLPVVLLTGWGEQIEPNQPDARAVDRILGKPVRLSDFLQTIAALCPPSLPSDGAPGTPS